VPVDVECGKESKLKPNDAVKCTDCGYRILYKKRIIDPKEPIQYEAI
jgi:DNA-directed RNA polymerase I, II, and III subunit RPABC4